MHRDDLVYILQFFKGGNLSSEGHEWQFYMLKMQVDSFIARLETLLVKYKQKKVITKVLSFTVTECWLLDMFVKIQHPLAMHDAYFQTLLRTLASELDKQIKQVVV